MKILALFLIFVNFFATEIEASCPYLLKAYQESQNLYESYQTKKNQLLNDGYNVSYGEPGYYQWQGGSLNPVKAELVRKSTVLYYTEQFYDQEYLTHNSGPVLTTDEKLEKLKSLSGCLNIKNRCRQTVFNPYEANLRYRTFDGTYNYIQDPLIGSTFTSYQKLIPPVYDDGIHAMRRNTRTNGPLPSPRAIGNAFFANPPSQSPNPNDALTVMGLIFAQWSGAHDVGSSLRTGPMDGGNGIRCCSKDYTKFLPNHLTSETCEPISIPQNDPFFSQFNMTCHNFMRSGMILNNDCQLGPAFQTTQVSSFMDNSNLYGDNEKQSQTLRATGGYLRIGPPNTLIKEPGCNNEGCYILGDYRNDQQTNIAALNILYLHLHNDLVTRLTKLNPNWSDEIVFQEARRIVIAIEQHLFYNEFLPIVFGLEYAIEKGLTCPQSLYCGKYNQTLPPATFDDYSTGALRTFHASVPTKIETYDKDYKLENSYWFSDVIYKPEYLSNQFLSFVRGMIMQPVGLDGYSPEMRNKVFKNTNKLGVGFDVIAVDVQRGRDHGIPPYYKYIEYCLPSHRPIKHWRHLEPIITHHDIEKLKTVYDSVHDMDLIVGIYFEKQTAYFGPVAKCILSAQYHRTKYSDRFFYNFPNSAYPFDTNQLAEINKYTVAKFLCHNAELDKVTQRPFIVRGPNNQFVNCSDLPQINLEFWSDRKSSVSSSSSSS